MPGTTVTADLVAEYNRHLCQLPVLPSDQRSMSNEKIVEHALAALAIGEEMARRVRRNCWYYVRDALRAGAAVRDAATAMGLDDDELRVGLRSWADGRRRVNQTSPGHGLTAVEVDEVQALLRPADAGDAP